MGEKKQAHTPFFSSQDAQSHTPSTFNPFQAFLQLSPNSLCFYLLSYETQTQLQNELLVNTCYRRQRSDLHTPPHPRPSSLSPPPPPPSQAVTMCAASYLEHTVDCKSLRVFTRSFGFKIIAYFNVFFLHLLLFFSLSVPTDLPNTQQDSSPPPTKYTETILNSLSLVFPAEAPLPQSHFPAPINTISS